MVNVQTSNFLPTYLLFKNDINGCKEPLFVDPFRLSRPIVSDDIQVCFKRTGKNDFQMQVISGNPENVAQCLNIVG